MSIFTLTEATREKVTCHSCGRHPGPREEFAGPRMWHAMAPVCRHEAFYLCPECWGLASARAAQCPACGCREFYC